MNSSKGITYESMETYLKNAEKQINSTLDINCFYNPFEDKHNFETINDLQIYCDTLLNHLSEELTQLSPNSHNFNHFNGNQFKNISIYENNNQIKQMVSFESNECQSLGLRSGSTSGLIVTNSDNSLVNSIPSPTISNSNTISSTSSDQKSLNNNNSNNNNNNNLINNNNDNSFHISYHRLSFYENNDEIAAQLLTAKQLHQIVSHFFKYLNYFFFLL
jgi:hypothetical protein